MECRADTENNEPTAQTEAVADGAYLWGKRHSALYGCALSSRYHRSRERFFDYLDRAANAAALIGGSAAFASASDADLVRAASAFVTFAAIISLVFAFAAKARRHASMAEQYKRIEADILRIGDFDYTEEQVNSWLARIAETEATEAPTLRTLVSLCQNDLAIAANQPEKVIEQPWLKRLLAHIFDIEPRRA